MKQTLLLLATLALLAMACTLQAAPAVITISTVTPEPASTVVDVEVEKVPTETTPTFTVAAYRLWVRDRDGERVGYLEQGESVSCIPTDSGWCLTETGAKVWAGCLDPNPKELGCEAK